MQPSAR
ncbi:hypothetical protein V1477_020232 [Vespula maculifrons]